MLYSVCWLASFEVPGKPTYGERAKHFSQDSTYIPLHNVKNETSNSKHQEGKNDPTVKTRKKHPPAYSSRVDSSRSFPSSLDWIYLPLLPVCIACLLCLIELGERHGPSFFINLSCSLLLLECHVISGTEHDGFRNNQPEKVRPPRKCHWESFGPALFANPFEFFQLVLQMFFKQDLPGCRKISLKVRDKSCRWTELDHPFACCSGRWRILSPPSRLIHYQGMMLLHLLLCICVHGLLQVLNFHDDRLKDLLHCDNITFYG